MQLAANRFRHKMASGKTQYGLWLGIPDTTAAEIAAGAGFDWLLIDAEHAPFDVRSVLAHLQALAPYDVAPIVRAVNGDPAVLKQLLDVGVQTLLIPMVDDALYAAELVAAVRYPPAGIRGVGTSLARAAGWSRVTDYLAQANDEICLLVQAESAQAMDNLEAIAAVDGVDGVFIGPSDLAASMGQLGNPGHPDVTVAIESGIRTITAAGKYAGLLALDTELAKDFAARGVSFIGVGVDTMLLAKATTALAAKFKDADAGPNDDTGLGY